MKHKVGNITRKFQRRIHMPLRLQVYAKALHGRKGFAKLRLLTQIIRHELRLVVRWWRLNDRRYTWRWRTANGVLAVLIFLGIALPIAQQLFLNNRYRLSADALSLVGASDPKLQSQLKYTGTGYQFNQAALQQTATMRAQAGAATGKGADTSTYALTVPQDFAKGTTYSDVNTGQSFQLVPQFSGDPVKEVQGHLVIPVDGAQAIYTLKGNGLKEDVVVPHATQDVLSFAYTLKLPQTLQAKVIPGSDGAIGIYSADPTLYGNISASYNKDQAALQKARENGDKTNLVFGLPSPTIKTLSGKLPHDASAQFHLQGNTLTVLATGLTNIHEPFTIDPSVVVTSASDFQAGGNNESMIAFDNANNRITRGGLTGGSLTNAVVSGAAPTIASTGAESSGTSTSTTVAVPSGIASGSLVVAHVWAVWESATAPTDSSMNMPAGWSLGYSSILTVTGGGYIYLAWYYHWATGSESTPYTFTAVSDTANLYSIHGEDARITGAKVSSGNPFSDSPHVNYGTSGSAVISSFTPSANYSLLLAGAGNLASSNSWTPPSGWTNNNYTYDSALMSTTQSTAAATGSLTFRNGGGDYTWASVITIAGATTATGGWAGTSSFTTARDSSATVAYNGYLYILGGYGSSTYRNDVQYAPINADGTVGTWKSTTSFTTGRAGHGAVAYNGYLYILGGYGGGYLNDVQYAPINADGTVGTWKSTTSFTTGRNSFGTVVYNGFLYVLGGNTNSTPFSDVQYAPINADGTVGTWNTTTSLPSGRDSFGAVVYNGYIYVLGGENSGYLNSVQYAPINSNGSVGSWSTAPSFTTARFSLNALVYNGYLYILGGANGSKLSDVQYAPINSNGSVGSWSTTTSFTTGRSNFSSATYNGYLYITGGYGSTYLNDVQYAGIDPAGITGNFAAATSLPSTYAVDGACSVAANGYMYEIGGTHAGSAQSAVYYTTINSDTTLGAWSTTTSLPAAIYYEGCAVANGYLYVVGGYTGTAGVTTVYYAALGSDGTIASWSSYTGTGTGSLPSSVYNAGVVIVNNYLYVIGGSGGNTAAVNFAQLKPSGGLVTTVSSCPSSGTLSHGTWCSTTKLPSGRIDTNAVASGNYIYEIAGYSGGATATVYYAAVNSNGTISSWQTSSHTLPTAVYWPSIVTTNGYIYVLGGYTGSATVSSVFYAAINANGDIGAWQNAPSLPAGQYEASAVAYYGTLYSLAGYTNAPQYTVYAAPINNGGSGLTGTFANNAAGWGWSSKGFIYGDKYVYQIGINSGIDYASYNANGSIGTSSDVADSTALNACDQDAEFELNDYIYSIGGNSCSTGVYSKLGSDGIPSGTSHMLSSVPSSDAYPSWATYNGYVYLTGGGSDDTSIYYAKPGSNGDISSWSTGTTLPQESYNSGLVAYNGYLYLTGGGNDSGNNTNTVAYAPISSDGSLGSWRYTSSMNQALYATAVAYDGYLYILGGYGSGFNAQITTEFAPILNNGSLGAWQSGTWLTGAQGYGSSGVHNGIIYAPNFDSYAPLNVIARTGQYSKVISFGSAVNITSITYNGAIPGGDSAVTYQTAEADGVFGSAATTASASGSGGCVGNASDAYYVRIHVTLDDSSGNATFPDMAGSANLTDFTINYNPVHPPPNIRLRLGQTLQSGVLSPFDTCIDANGTSTGDGGGSGSRVVAIPNTSGDHTVANGNTSGNPITLTKPANTADNDLLVCVLFDRNTNTNSFPAISGWTQLSTGGTVGTAGGFAVYYMPVTTAASLPSSWSVTLGGSRTIAMVFRVTGANLTTPIADQGANKAFGSDGSDTTLGSVTVPTNGAAFAVMGSFWSETADVAGNNSIPGLSLMLTETNPSSGTGRGTAGVYTTTTAGSTGTVTPTGWLNGTIGTNGASGRLFAINPD